MLDRECLSQLHILNSMDISKFSDHKNGRTKPFQQVRRYKETTPRKLQQRKYTIILWHFPSDCELNFLYRHLSKLLAEHRKTDKSVIFTLVNSLSFVCNHWDAEISRVVCRLAYGFIFGWAFVYWSGPQNRRWFKKISKFVPRGKRVNKIYCVHISGTLRLSCTARIVSIYAIQIYHVVLQKMLPQ